MELSFVLLLWGLSNPRIAELREMPQSFSIKLHSATQVSGRLGMSGGISPRHAQNPLSGERRKTLSITHHALSPPPSHHHLYIIHLINWLQRYYRIIKSLHREAIAVQLACGDLRCPHGLWSLCDVLQYHRPYYQLWGHCKFLIFENFLWSHDVSGRTGRKVK